MQSLSHVNIFFTIRNDPLEYHVEIYAYMYIFAHFSSVLDTCSKVCFRRLRTKTEFKIVSQVSLKIQVKLKGTGA